MFNNRNILLEIDRIKNQVCKLVGNSIGEAPLDGQIYGRQDGAWVVAGGGGGSQDLQQTLDNGSTVTGDNDILFNGDNRIVFLETGTENELAMSGTGISLKQNVSEAELQLNINNTTELGDYPNLGFVYNGASSQLLMNPEIIAGSGSVFYLPKSYTSGGSAKTLATTDDITLQSMVNNDLNEASKDASYLSLLSGSGAFINFTSAIDNGLTGVDNVSTEIKNTPQQARMKVYSNDAINIDEILVTPLGTQISTENAIGSIVIKTQQPIASGVVNLNFPTKTVAGNYIISTIEDILSLGSLIPTYADNAAAVTGGLTVNKIYKTATGEIRVVV